MAMKLGKTKLMCYKNWTQNGTQHDDVMLYVLAFIWKFPWSYCRKQRGIFSKVLTGNPETDLMGESLLKPKVNKY